jgi:hypothetical protein
MLSTAMTRTEFVNRVLQIAQAEGYPVKINRDGRRQIDFGHKQLHEEHLRQLFPDILMTNASVNRLVDKVAPGRPCAHKPLREIIAKLALATPTM